jgi:hypothetical protein
MRHFHFAFGFGDVLKHGETRFKKLLFIKILNRASADSHRTGAAKPIQQTTHTAPGAV